MCLHCHLVVEMVHDRDAERVLQPDRGRTDTVDVAELEQAVQSGLWSGTLSFPMVAVHAHLLPDGKVLVSEGQDLGADARVGV